MRKLAPVFLAALLGACASPSAGPTVGDIQNARLPGSNQQIPIVALADAPFEAVTPTPIGYTAAGEGLSRFGGSGSSDERLRPGDVIEVSILDTGEDGLMSPTDSKMLNLGRFTVDQSGFVTLPFVGRQRVVDSSPEALQNRIVTGLRGSAVNPQAVVSVVDKPTSSVTVNGGVRSAGRFPLTSNRERILDALALAGGAESAPGATTVSLIRGSQKASVPLDRIMAEDRQNVRLLPGDQVFVEGNAPSFTAFGAFKSTGEFDFETGKLTLAQALARAGGLLDDRANARNVYLFRNQPVYAAAGKSPGQPLVTVRPVIYRVDLRDVVNFALMQQFQMRDGDILYATNANMVDAAKLLTVFQKSAPLPAAPPPGN